MKNREKILIIILLTLLLVVGINFVIKEKERRKNEEIFRAKELKILDTENKAKDAMDKMDCPFPLIDYNKLSDKEKAKFSPALNNLLLSLSITKQKCSDYFPEIKYLWQNIEPEDRWLNINASAPLIFINNDKILIIINAISSIPATSTSTPPVYTTGGSNQRAIRASSTAYKFYGLNITPAEAIKMAQNNNIYSIDFGENSYMELID